MSETAAVIANGVDKWLRDEVQESHDGRNRFLDDFAATRASYLTGTTAYDLDIAKIASHYGRFKLVAEGVASLSSKPNERGEYAIAKAIHHALMFVSGGFRTQAFLEASSQDEYEHNRFSRLHEFNGATSIDLTTGIGELLVEASGISTAQELKEYSLDHNENIYAERPKMYQWFSDNPERAYHALSPNDLPVEIAVETQKRGLAIALGHIAFFGNRLEAGLAGVPFLEPKSISDVSPHPIYPLAA